MSTPAVTPPAPAPTVRGLLADTWRIRSQRRLLIITLALGVAVTVALTVWLPPDLLEFALYSYTTQLLMSVTLPFLGVVMVRTALRRPAPVRLAPVLTAALLVAAAVAVFGVAVNTLAVELFAEPHLRTSYPAIALITPIPAQLLAQSVGTGLGLLLRRPVIASLATIVLPIGVYLLLGYVGDASLRQWLTPLGSAEVMLPGSILPWDWAVWAVVALLWGVAPNVAGVLTTRSARRG